jgi:hypothetical protein
MCFGLTGLAMVNGIEASCHSVAVGRFHPFVVRCSYPILQKASTIHQRLAKKVPDRTDCTGFIGRKSKGTASFTLCTDSRFHFLNATSDGCETKGMVP